MSLGLSVFRQSTIETCIRRVCSIFNFSQDNCACEENERWRKMCVHSAPLGPGFEPGTSRLLCEDE